MPCFFALLSWCWHIQGNHWRSRGSGTCGLRSGYVSVSRALEIHWANLHCAHAQYIVYFMTVSLNLEIIYSTYWGSYILVLMLLFLKILYNKIICPVLTECWHLNIIQCRVMHMCQSQMADAECKCSQPYDWDDRSRNQILTTINFNRPFLERWSDETLNLMRAI